MSICDINSANINIKKAYRQTIKKPEWSISTSDIPIIATQLEVEVDVDFK